MNYTVSSFAIISMALTLICSVAIPIGLFVYLWRKRGCDAKPFFVGVVIMFVFAFILEQIGHGVILSSPFGGVLQDNIWLYALYGGIMAALFEESGRWIAFKFFLKNNMNHKDNALMYGAGHGGIEVLYVLLLSMMGNLFMAYMMNSGSIAGMTEGMTAENIAQLEESLRVLSETSPLVYIAAVAERVAAVVLQMSLSVLVWFSVKEGKAGQWLWCMAFLIHMAVDMVAVLLNNYTENILIIEVVVWVMALAAAWFARTIYLKNNQKA